MLDIEKKYEINKEEAKYTTANGKEVFITAETKDHLRAHPDVVEYLAEAISKANIPDKLTIYKETVDMGRTVGVSALVKTDRIFPDDEADFSNRVEREHPVRVILNIDGQPSPEITIKVVFDEISKKYLLQTAWVGPDAPPLPYNTPKDSGDELEKSLQFWCDHALAFDSKIMENPFKSSWNTILNKIKN